MIKNNLNYKLVNFLLVLLIILIIYNTRTLWLSIYDFCINIIKPFIISIIISYVFNLYLKKLNKYFNKIISILIFISSIIASAYILIKLIISISSQITDCISMIYYFIKTYFIKYNINFIDLYNYFQKITNINIIDNIFNYISLITIVISLSIYIFLDWNKIKRKIKLLSNRSTYDYIKSINTELEKYTYSFFLLILINIIEYSLIFFLVGHPNYLLLGLLAGILSIIPVIGGMITNVLALVTAFVINYRLFIRTLIGILVLSILDSYIISPLVYSRSTKLHPILVIIAIFIGTKLFGFLGTILAIPVLIIIISSYQYMNKKHNITQYNTGE